jgi:hypothetical protein
MAAVHANSAANNLGDLSMEEQVQAYIDSLSAAQIAALTAQATSGILSQDARNASQFQALLEQLTGLGLDGGLFQELATSGNLSAAGYYATLTEAEIEALEQQYANRNEAAQQVGSYAASAEFRDDIRHQTRVFEHARDDFREARQSLRRLERRMERMERLAEKNPKDTGRATADALNGAAAKAQRSA